MTPYPESRPTDLRHYFGVLRSQWRPIVAGTAVGLLAATGVLAFTGSSYTATTDLNINVISTDPFNAQRSASGLLDGVTEAQIAGSYAVAMRAAEDLDTGVTAQRLRAGAEVNPVADATIIRISYSAPTADDARAGADSIAAAYLSYRASQARERLGSVIDRIEERLSGLREELTDANARAAASEPGSSGANQAASDRDLVTIEIDSLLEEKNALDLIDTAGGAVLSTASENELKFGPRPVPILLTGLLAGLALGVIGAFVMDGVGRKIATVGDVQRATGGPVLAHITSRATTIPATGSTLDELRTGRERVYAALDGGWNVIALFDCGASDRTSDIPVNWALVFAQDGRSTHLVLPGTDDRDRDFLVDALGLVDASGPAGGSSYCASDTLLWLHLPDAAGVERPDDRTIRFLTSVVAEADPDDLVIIAIPSRSSHSDALSAGRLADAMALIVSLGSTGQSRITALLEEPALEGTAFLGTVVAPEGRSLTPAPRPESVLR